MNLVLMQKKGLFVLPPHFRDLHHASHNFDDFLFPIPSCYPSILCRSTLLIWEKERNLSKAFTGQDRVMKNCNVTALYQLNLKWFKVPSLLGNSQKAWADHHPYVAAPKYQLEVSGCCQPNLWACTWIPKWWPVQSVKRKKSPSICWA